MVNLATYKDSSGSILDNRDDYLWVAKPIGGFVGNQFTQLVGCQSCCSNGPDCIETSPSYGDCGLRSVVVNGPRLIRFDLSMAKRVRVKGSVSAEFKVEMLNALNSPYFNPASNGGIPLGMNSTNVFTSPGGPVFTGTPVVNASAGSSVDSFRLTQLLGDNQARIVQLVWRVRW